MSVGRASRKRLAHIIDALEMDLFPPRPRLTPPTAAKLDERSAPRQTWR